MSILSGTLGAVMGSNAQDQATSTQAATAASGLAQQEALYAQDVARNKPFYDQGVQANANLNRMVNGGYNMQESPAAQYQLQAGTKSLNRQLAARGLLGSGNAAQRLAELSSGIAANDYDKQYSRLLDQIKIGTGASAATGAASNTLSGNIGQTSAMLQASQGAAGANRAALYSGMGAQSSNAAGTALNAYRAYQAYNGAGAAGAGAGADTYGALSTGAAAADIDGIAAVAL